MARFLALLAVVGCSEEIAPGGVEKEPGAARVLEEGTPDALGVAAMLNDPSTTVSVLDVDAKLDARAAKNLVAHRDGADARLGTADDDLFDSVAEIDAVSYVGDSALQALVDYARAEGWVAEDDDYYGVVEGVELTVTEADAAIWAANTGTYGELDAFLDSRAATALVANRPFATVEAVAAQSYVGKTALEGLVAYGLEHGPADGPGAAEVAALLDSRASGLWFTSESDYRLVSWTLPVSGPVAAADAKSVLAPVWQEHSAARVADDGEVGLADRRVEEITLARLFDRYTVEQDWWEDTQREEQARWQAVRDVFEHDLAGAQVIRIGRTNSRGTVLVGAIDVYVFGTAADGQLVGLWTVAVET